MRRSVLSQENAGDILAGLGVDHHEIDFLSGPIVNFVEAAKMELLVHQDGSGIDGGANELEADRFASSMWHRFFYVSLRTPRKSDTLV